MNAAEIRKLIEDNGWDDKYSYIGIRSQDQEFALGQFHHQSVVWDDGNETDEVLDGACCTDYNSRALGMHTGEDRWARYNYKHTAIIASDYADYGEDEGELIISDPEVLYIIR
jgi:hypothetical protein